MKISGYTTTYNCRNMWYPIKECVESLLLFCDEVCIVDAGSQGEELTYIQEIAKDSRVKLEVSPVDFSHPRWAMHIDGYLKAQARDMCTGDVCFQIDSDQIVSEKQIDDTVRVCEIANDKKIIVGLHQVEFWGGLDTVRSDLTPKPMVSPNLPNITHGIRQEAKALDSEGREYCTPFISDSCDFINKHNHEAIPVGGYANTPLIYHVSWLNLERKVDHYKKFWHKFHQSMYNLPEDHNAMFDKPWENVDSIDVQKMAKKLESLGPRPFHSYEETWQGKSRPITKVEIQNMPKSLTTWYDALLHKSD